MTNQASFRRANQICNRELTLLKAPDLCFPILYWGFMPKHYDNSMHRHSFFEACYVMDGEGLYIEEGVSYPLCKGTSFLSLPGAWHQIRSQTGLTLCYVAFEVHEEATSHKITQAFRALIDNGAPVVYEVNHQPTGHLWNTLLSLFHDTKPAWPAILEHAAMSLVLSFLALHGSSPAVKANETTDKPLEENMLLRQAKLFIDDNLSAELTLMMVANHLHISSRHLTRLFQEHMSQSFVHYIQERRVQLASHLLLHENLPIKEIASRCGFQSVHYFTRIFTQKLGVSPAKFRRSQFAEGRSGKEQFPNKMS
ncbi:helix-turn-helix transcriptional regulator [Paenibacillus sp. 1001270B_150601_E10]|uniref:helix-turn-helix transcriptional regulator n=1 Tax=Paenibacillus sp. 1001270B_150601_E10 TaxID=2787079 RepID=UPI0018A0A436|nr:AraC family transcriptional regulator [Paenibacillus sp. 1001270B_150601_E10]